MDEQPNNEFPAGRTSGWATILAIGAIAFVIWLNYLASRETRLHRDLKPTVMVKQSQ
jgi:hypothetical protein